jgi:hypothetical protein
MGWTVWRSNPGEGEIFRPRPDRPWGPPILLYNAYGVFLGRKAARAWRWPPTYSAEVKGRVEIYLFSTSTYSWPVLGWNLPLPFMKYKYTCPCARHEDIEGNRGIVPLILNLGTKWRWAVDVVLLLHYLLRNLITILPLSFPITWTNYLLRCSGLRVSLSGWFILIKPM